MNNSQLCESVAKLLGLVYEKSGPNVLCSEWGQYHSPFSPATDIAAAIWAINKYCDSNGLAWAMFRIFGSVGVAIAESMHQLEFCNVVRFYEDECTAICRAILASV